MGYQKNRAKKKAAKKKAYQKNPIKERERKKKAYQKNPEKKKLNYELNKDRTKFQQNTRDYAKKYVLKLMTRKVFRELKIEDSQEIHDLFFKPGKFEVFYIQRKEKI